MERWARKRATEVVLKKGVATEASLRLDAHLSTTTSVGGRPLDLAHATHAQRQRRAQAGVDVPVTETWVGVGCVWRVCSERPLQEVRMAVPKSGAGRVPSIVDQCRAKFDRRWTKSDRIPDTLSWTPSQLLSKSGQFGRVWLNSGQVLSKSGQIRSDSTQFWPMWANMGRGQPNYHQSWSIPGCICHKLRLMWTEFDQCLVRNFGPETGRQGSDFDPNWCFGRTKRAQNPSLEAPFECAYRSEMGGFYPFKCVRGR